MSIKKIMQKDFLTFTEEAKLTKVVGGLLKSKKRSAIVVNQNDEYLGVVSRRKLLSRKYGPESKAANVIIKTPIVLDDLDLVHTAQLMHKTGVQVVPVERKQKLVGLIRILDLLQELSLELGFAGRKVGSLKLSKPTPLSENDSVAKALSIMLKEKVDHVLIFSGRELQGVLSLRDVLRVAMVSDKKMSNPSKAGSGIGSRAASPERKPTLELPVKSFMTKLPLLTVNRNNTIFDAIALMHKKNIRDLIVEEEGKVFGLVTVKEVLDVFMAEQFKPEMKLQLNGFKKLGLHDLQEARILALIRSEVLKLQRKHGDSVKTSMHFKIGRTQAKQQQYIVKLKLDTDSNRFMADSNEWKLEAAIRNVFKSLDTTIKKKNSKQKR